MAFELFLSKKLNKEQVNPRAKKSLKVLQKNHEILKKNPDF